jgi:hypothetical protein
MLIPDPTLKRFFTAVVAALVVAACLPTAIAGANAEFRLGVPIGGADPVAPAAIAQASMMGMTVRIPGLAGPRAHRVRAADLTQAVWGLGALAHLAFVALPLTIIHPAAALAAVAVLLAGILWMRLCRWAIIPLTLRAPSLRLIPIQADSPPAPC